MGINRRNDTLAKRIIQRVVDGQRAEPQPARDIAVDIHHNRSAPAQNITGNIAEVVVLLQRRRQFRTPFIDHILIRALKRKTIGVDPGGGIDREILYRPEIDADARDIRNRFFQTVRNVRQIAALAFGLQVNEHPPLGNGRILPVDTDRGTKAVDCRIA